MNNDPLYTTNRDRLKDIWLIPGILISIFLGWLVSGKGMSVGVLLSVFPFLAGFFVLIFLKPRIGLIFFLIYCFIMPTLGKHIDGLQAGLGQDALLILTWLGIIFQRTRVYKFRHLNNDLMWLTFVWFVITVLEIANPERPSILGWVYEMRSATLYWILSVPLVFLVFNKKSDIDLFFNIIIILSLIGAIYGAKQLMIGPDAAENRWLEAGAKKTHVLFGKLRVFSYYSDAAQFGSSQAHVSIMCLILASGAHSFSKKLWYAFAGVIIFYGMLISGTRGALFAFVGGGATFLVLSKQVKILILGGVLGLAFLGMLKYTNIGSGNQQINRMRTSLDPEDASFQVRLINQKILKDYLASRPFGTGVGTIGMWGVTYNADKYISRIPPDSLYVKIWAMYGIVGFILWLGIMLYITGKSAGIIWNTRDPVLRNQLAALCGGATGVLLCSYGNEVLNAMPTSAIVYISWGLIWLSPRWDKPQPKTIEI
ncbi:O-antigen ligase like membrane protein [Pseudarcicella hirudinis]|uniref:O-antigen ligase like membrane protein n=1 Tax=Pseudarcicella hirudinis TaxID=1079859 RepID=A0A1I5XAU4_9BACT|nr:O-antigen ligase family protein [Pseudarcicella hirudinis]SFQ29014.1 O-antigen ligase like membrane protein [Pseudarcicella hirudinis]